MLVQKATDTTVKACGEAVNYSRHLISSTKVRICRQTMFTVRGFTATVGLVWRNFLNS